jgi:hypothetical protein
MNKQALNDARIERLYNCIPELTWRKARLSKMDWELTSSYLSGYRVKTKSLSRAASWQAEPHLASFACGGLSCKLPGLKVFDESS